ncbi:ExbD/TolR family protein [Parasedimentitalea psychrophila]|uniref:Biopolymer transporter ExbD n=1 Tax=Parasedimentitalea psychrophila TaxID=2997337 RepID=A0A9Y2P3M3_9RHOB|nr:biopolymer transporter ExbD [Parasedimentitalea psychrophila]WIY27811.1 biopolymer transporter ExbD [Parasedimentitalea psychrophila]
MKLTRPKRAAQSETIVALIDVVFFLLVFFMLIGRMDATAPFEVRPPIAQTGRDMPAGGITLAIAADGALALDGDDISKLDLDAALSAQLERQPELRLRINAHRAAELRHVLPYVTRAETLGIRDVVLVVTPERDQ